MPVYIVDSRNRTKRKVSERTLERLSKDFTPEWSHDAYHLPVTFEELKRRGLIS